jgi:hypothetical protein
MIKHLSKKFCLLPKQIFEYFYNYRQQNLAFTQNINLDQGFPKYVGIHDQFP